MFLHLQARSTELRVVARVLDSGMQHTPISNTRMPVVGGESGPQTSACATVGKVFYVRRSLGRSRIINLIACVKVFEDGECVPKHRHVGGPWSR
jgi:hypothetical protein